MGFDGIGAVAVDLNEGRLGNGAPFFALHVGDINGVNLMIDIGSLASLAGSLKTAGDIAQTLVGLRDANLIQQKVIDLNREIIAAQSSAITTQSQYAALTQQVRDLIARIAELEAWEQEKLRYQLTDHGGGTFTYALKAGMENGEPFHRICAHCYQVRRKSLLQSHGNIVGGREKVTCHACNGEILLGEYRRSPTPSSYTDSWRA